MEPLRDSLLTLTAGFFKTLEKEQGRDTALRFLWPILVGPQLAANTEMEYVRGKTLVVSVPDRSWLASLGSLDKLILEAVNRAGGKTIYDAIEFLEKPRMSRPVSHQTAGLQSSGHRVARTVKSKETQEDSHS